jgi:predicted HicB family RNase H-like nuclease
MPMMQVRVTEATYKRYKKKAKRAEMTLSGWVREVLKKSLVKQ